VLSNPIIPMWRISWQGITFKVEADEQTGYQEKVII